MNETKIVAQMELAQLNFWKCELKRPTHHTIEKYEELQMTQKLATLKFVHKDRLIKMWQKASKHFNFNYF